MILDPNGRLLAGPLIEQEGVLTAGIDVNKARAQRRTFDPVGHYSRPDVFRLAVDPRPKAPVTFDSD